MALRTSRPLTAPKLIVVGDLHAPGGLELGFELWREPFQGWGESHELRARAQCVPRRYVIIDGDGIVRSSGPIAPLRLLPGEPLIVRVAGPAAA